MDVHCPECREPLKIDNEEIEEGDLINCPACNLELTVVKRGKSLSVKTVKEKFMEEDEEGYFEEDEEEDEDY